VNNMVRALQFSSFGLRPQQQEALRQQVTPQLLQQLLMLVSRCCNITYTDGAISRLSGLCAGAASTGELAVATVGVVNKWADWPCLQTACQGHAGSCGQEHHCLPLL
jgi:hypothetical protein